jgi:SAM-dependent methyltransferase
VGCNCRADLDQLRAYPQLTYVNPVALLASRRVAYHDWHLKPGYWADITRHFSQESNLLDIGCGTAWLAEHFPHYTGIDGSPAAVEAAVARGFNVTRGDLNEPLPFADATFDAAVLKDVLEHVDNPADLVGELRRVLRPGAVIYACSPDAQRWVWDDYTHRRPFTRKSFRKIFVDQGLVVEHVGYESVFPGVGIVSARTRSHRRPIAFRLLALLPFHRRNVWALARRT